MTVRFGKREAFGSKLQEGLGLSVWLVGRAETLARPEPQVEEQGKNCGAASSSRRHRTPCRIPDPKLRGTRL